MFKITGKVNVVGYEEWVRQVQSNFSSMVNTMSKVAQIIEMQTIPYVPLDTSTLEQSYTSVIVESSDFILMSVGFDAVDEDSGFHYAEYQHNNEDLNHPRRGIPFYLTEGIKDSKDEWMEMISTDYLSLFTSGGFVEMSIGSIDTTIIPI